MHKISKTIMHLWISVVSLGAFVFSWVLLVHSPKPAPLAVLKPVATQSAPVDASQLQPIPSLSDLLKSNSSQIQRFTPNNTTTFQSQPRLRARGS
jgi:hypothetical protein